MLVVGVEGVDSENTEPVLMETFCCLAMIPDSRQNSGIRCFGEWAGGKPSGARWEEKRARILLDPRLLVVDAVEESSLCWCHCCVIVEDCGQMYFYRASR